MTKYLNIIYFLTTLSLLVALIISFHNNYTLENRINTINKFLLHNGTPENFDSEKSFKEDYYIVQQSRDTNLILVIFPILVGFVALFSYVNVLNKFSSYTGKLELKVREQESKWSAVFKELDYLKTKISLDNAELNKEKAKKYLEERNYSFFVHHSLMSTSFYADYYFFLKKDPNETNDGIREIIMRDTIKSLKQVYEVMEQNKDSLTDILYLLIESDVKRVRELNEKKISSYLSKIEALVV
jgi:hypothetical protein